MFQILEHPYEKEFLQTLQDLVLVERLNLKNLIYNLTSNLTDEDLFLLQEYANRDSEEENTLKVYQNICC